jgi:hypothetical protein
MALIGWLLLLGLAVGCGWLARLRLGRSRRFARVRDVLLQTNVGGDTFRPETVDGLPVPAARYLRHAIEPGAALARSVDVHMVGKLRVGADDWVPFEARERICPERGFIWQARTAALRRLALEGADWLLGEDAGIEYALAGWWPVVTHRGGDLARSAAGRLLVDLVWLPGALTPQRGANWSSGDPDRAVVTLPGSATPMTVCVAADGGLREASIVRRRFAPDGRISVAPYGVSVEASARFDGLCVPTRLVAAWGIGTDAREDFMRVEVDDIRWL